MQQLVKLFALLPQTSERMRKGEAEERALCTGHR